MGLLVSVYRDGDMDCSANGISKFANTLCVVNIPDSPFQPGDGVPAVMLVPGNLPNTAKIVPAIQVAGEWVDGPRGMFGGNFAYTSDSRFHNAVAKLVGYRHGAPVAIHDRYES